MDMHMASRILLVHVLVIQIYEAFDGVQKLAAKFAMNGLQFHKFVIAARNIIF
jgi:hypothetical protein